MRIGLYGMPTAGKTHVLDRINFMEVVTGSRLLRELDPDFDKRDETGREHDREELARLMSQKDEFIMDGHFAFGNEIAFTEKDGEMYDAILYLYVAPEILQERILNSEKNHVYAGFDVKEWQKREISGLREYCQEKNKDFYVLDNPPHNVFGDVSDIICFIRQITEGYSCATFAKRCAEDILEKSGSDTVVLLDGDKTLTMEDSSNAVFQYRTTIFDGNFYTGFQAWKQSQEFKEYSFGELTELPVRLNEKVRAALPADSFILTSGHGRVWDFISKNVGIDCYYGMEMSAETKLYVTKFLQAEGKRVIAYGDGMNDYYMLMQADEGYLVAKPDGTVSRSLRGKNLEGLIIV